MEQKLEDRLKQLELHVGGGDEEMAGADYGVGAGHAMPSGGEEQLDDDAADTAAPSAPGANGGANGATISRMKEALKFYEGYLGPSLVRPASCAQARPCSQLATRMPRWHGWARAAAWPMLFCARFGLTQSPRNQNLVCRLPATF